MRLSLVKGIEVAPTNNFFYFITQFCALTDGFVGYKIKQRDFVVFRPWQAVVINRRDARSAYV